MDYAAENALLDHDIIWDGTASGGGSNGVYAIRRLSAKPFRTTFGNIRISDIVPLFVADRVKRQQRASAAGGQHPAPPEMNGDWLLDWLTDDVLKAYNAGQGYTNNVPFKLAHAPKFSDGIITPATVHFSGNMVCLLGPHGGSHLDQFAAIAVDNDLCHTIGMQTGGYSNTWEWAEEVAFPTTGEPVIGFMWSVGQTIRPNGEILEGNPAAIAEEIPLTHENFAMSSRFAA